MGPNQFNHFMEAVEAGDYDGVKALLPKINPMDRNERGEMALMLAARSCHTEIVKLLIPVSDPTADDSKALCEAAENGHKEIVAALLMAGADPKAKHSRALRWAARYGHKEIVEMLIPVSDPKAWDSEALRYAAENGHEKIVEMLIPVSDPKAEESDALSLAVKYGRKEVVRMLLPVSDPKARDSVALRVAALRGHKEIVEMMLAAGADPEAKNKDGMTASGIASRTNHHDCVEVIEAHLKAKTDAIASKLGQRRGQANPSALAVDAPPSGPESAPKIRRALG